MVYKLIKYKLDLTEEGNQSIPKKITNLYKNAGNLVVITTKVV